MAKLTKEVTEKLLSEFSDMHYIKKMWLLRYARAIVDGNNARVESLNYHLKVSKSTYRIKKGVEWKRRKLSQNINDCSDYTSHMYENISYNSIGLSEEQIKFIIDTVSCLTKEIKWMQ